MVARNRSNEIRITRVYDAPVEAVWDAWTDPKHVSRWLAPTGFRMTFLRSDIRVGASTFYVMTNDAGMTMYGRAKYLEITRPNRLVYTQQFCDENENVSRHPMAPVWPETMLTTVTLSEEGPDQTRVRVEWEPYGEATREEIEAFVQARASMTGGWTGSFDKLEDLLS